MVHRLALLGAAASVAALASGSGAFAQGTAAEQQSQQSAMQAAQQERMRACNADVGKRDLGDDARHAFTGDCLAGRTGAGAAPRRRRRVRAGAPGIDRRSPT